MILEIDELDFRRVTTAQLSAVRPKLERLADITCRNLRLFETVLGVTDEARIQRRKHDLALSDLLEANARIDALGHDLATARAWIDQLQDRLAEIEDDEGDRLYRSVGLVATAHTVVIAAARRALLQHHHPDRWPSGEKAAATARFQAANAAFTRIEELRR